MPPLEAMADIVQAIDAVRDSVEWLTFWLFMLVVAAFLK